MSKNKPGYPTKVFLNGEIVDAENAKISVFDRGFIFGDGIYEVIARINGNFFFKEAHFRRLQWCLDEIRIPFDANSLESIIPKLLEVSGLEDEDCMLYIQLSRGAAPRQHSFPEDIQPTVMMYAWPKTLPDINTAHASVTTREDYRWSRCDIKSTSLLGNIMANEYAMENNCYETLFIRDGRFTEASHCNVFFVKDGIIYTHPKGPYILGGITRQVVLQLCEELQLELREEAIRFDELTQIDEAFLTGTSTQVLAIKHIDDHQLFEDRPGEITRQLQEAFLALKRRSGQ